MNAAMGHPPTLLTPRGNRWSKAFSLIEVVLAVGVVSFALLPLMALLPIGLQTVRDSMDQTVTAGIAQQLRGELQQIPFTSTSSSGVTIANLPKQTYFYTSDGIKQSTTQVTTTSYYIATFSVSSPTIAGSSFTSTCAQIVTVTLKYPASFPHNTNIISLLAAKQN